MDNNLARVMYSIYNAWDYSRDGDIPLTEVLKVAPSWNVNTANLASKLIELGLSFCEPSGTHGPMIPYGTLEVWAEDYFKDE